MSSTVARQRRRRRRPKAAGPAVLLLSLLTAPAASSSLRVSGMQPRGNAVLRDARASKRSHIVVEPKQTDRLRAEAMTEFGLNLNDYWTLRSGTIAESLPASSEAKGEALDRMRRQAALEEADRKRLQAERRLQSMVRRPHDDDARHDGASNIARRPSSNARAAARLFMAIAEARRLGCRMPQLLRQAEQLHALLERAAAEEYARSRDRPERHPPAVSTVELPLGREALVLKIARECWMGTHGVGKREV